VPVIDVQHLSKRYRDHLAVDDLSFSVERGEIFGILGPNGAGKTTTVEIIGGLRTADAGSVSVLGLDPRGDELRQRVGAQLQEAQLPDKLKVWEALDLYSSFYPTRPTGRSCWRSSGWPTSAPPPTTSSPAARSSGCRSRSRWPAIPRSPSSTS